MAYRDAGEGAQARIAALEQEVERLRTAALEEVAAEKLAAYEQELERLERRLSEQAEEHNARLVAVHEEARELQRRFQEELEAREAHRRAEVEHLRVEQRAISAQADISRRELSGARSWVAAARKAGGLPPPSYHEACIRNLERDLERARAAEQKAEAKRREVEGSPPDVESVRSSAERFALEQHHAVARKRAEIDHELARMAVGQIESALRDHARELEERRSGG